MKYQPYRGYYIYTPTSGGKAGKGHNKTTTLQVRKLLSNDRMQIVHKHKITLIGFLAIKTGTIACMEWIDKQLKPQTT